jgi:hypothetical protein
MIIACGHRGPLSLSPRADGGGTAPMPPAIARTGTGARTDRHPIRLRRRAATSAGALPVIRHRPPLYRRVLHRLGRGTGKPGTRQCTQLLRWIKLESVSWYHITGSGDAQFLLMVP